MATSSITNDFLVDIFDMPAISISAGTIGTYATAVSCSITKVGYHSVACSILTQSHPRQYLAIPVLTNETVRADLYRVVNEAISQ